MNAMRSIRVGVFVSLIAIAACALAARAEEPVVAGKIESVTLYRGQALVTRDIPIDAAQGRVEIAVGPLPEQVLQDSLFAEGGLGVDVRAVRFRTRAVGAEPRDEVRKLDLAIEALQDKIAHTGKMQELAHQRLAYMDKMENFVAPTANVEMAKGVLNAETLKSLALFSFDQRKAANEEILTLANEARDLGKQLDLATRQREELTNGASRTIREAVLFLDKKAPGPTSVKLSYLAGGAGWMPAYNVRATQDGKEVRIEYNGLIQQMTGEDWNGVALTLSTASPGISADAPGLAPFRVTLARGAKIETQQSVSGNFAETFSLISQRKQQAEYGLRGNGSRKIIVDNQWQINAAANDFQNLELFCDKDVLKQAQKDNAALEGPSINYAMENAVSVSSRSDQQLVRISESKLDAVFVNLANPVLTSYVYRQAELTNTAADALLAGTMNVYMDGRFVGRGELPTVARGETFVVGFGTDSQIRARRELADKSDHVQGGNRELSLKYRLVIENFKDKPVAVRVMDRSPVADNANDIRVTVESPNDKLSTDALYLRVERPKGILRWEVTVEPKAAGEKARLIEYGYKVEFDRNLAMASNVNNPVLQQEFEQLQELRNKK